MTLNVAALSPPPAGSPVRLRGLLPHEIHRTFATAGVDEAGARRLFGAAVGRFPADVGAVRGIRRVALDKVVRESDLYVPGVVECSRAADGFAKYLLALRDGSRVEAVWIPLERPRASICISCMVGCPLDCAFCATAKIGFSRPLEADEMVGQFLRLREASPRPVSGAVFMGMGEPLLNYDAVLRAATILCTPGGGGIAAEAISIGTAGVVPAIRRYTAERHPFRLVVSLSAAREEKRRASCPMRRAGAWRSSGRRSASTRPPDGTGSPSPGSWCRDSTPGRRTPRIWPPAWGVPLRIDLIDVCDPLGRFRPPGDAEREAFRSALAEATGQMVVRRYSGGTSIGAGCGQLAGGGMRRRGSLATD